MDKWYVIKLQGVSNPQTWIPMTKPFQLENGVDIREFNHQLPSWLSVVEIDKPAKIKDNS